MLKSSGEGTIVVCEQRRARPGFIAHDLVDEYELFLHPLLLAREASLPRSWSGPGGCGSLGCAPTSTGVVMLTYAPE